MCRYKYAVTTDNGRLLHDPVPFKSAPLPGTLPTREKTSRLLSGGQITRPAYRFWVIGAWRSGFVGGAEQGAASWMASTYTRVHKTSTLQWLSLRPCTV